MSNHGRSQQGSRAPRGQGNPGAASAGESRQLSVTARIRAALDQDPRFLDVSPREVRVREHNGSIRLDGWVPRLADRQRIGEAVTRLAMPAPVESCLLVGPPGQHPDNAIQRAVLDFMMADRAFDPTSIHAEVTSGVVHLTGLIDTSIHQRYAGALCWWIPGVRGVRNDLQVIYPESENDELLAETVQLLQDKDPLVDVTEILILSQGGVITLSGTVAGQVARDAAESDAWAVEGVREVINQIEVASIPGAPPILGFGG